MISILQAAGGGNGAISILMFVLIIVVFYFFMIRPQMKRQKELRKFQDALKKGDSVVVAGGIYGKVAEVRDAEVVVEVAKDVEIRVAKGSVFADAIGASGR